MGLILAKEMPFPKKYLNFVTKIHVLTSKIVEITQAKWLHQGKDISIKHLLTDSRKVTDAKHTMFFALPGKVDAHVYVADLYQKGCRNFVVSEAEHYNYGIYINANFLLVPHTLTALQTIASKHRQAFNIPVIGITGSNGKTIVKEWLNFLLSPEQSVVRSPKSYNSQIGVPLSVWNISEAHTFGIFEAGISTINEMEKLANIIQPSIGVLTHIGAAHSQGFENDTEKYLEKTKLFKSTEVVIGRRKYFLEPIDQKLFTYEINEASANVNITSMVKEGSHTIINYNFKNESQSFKIAFTDEAAIENVLTCLSTLLYLGYEANVIAERMLYLPAISMRMELKSAINQCFIINDAYSADLDSLRIALNFLTQQNQTSKKTVILSDIVETGLEPKLLYNTVNKLLVEHKINKLITIGQDIGKVKFEIPATHYESTANFLDKVDINDFSHETILIKGSRSFEFEHIAQILTLKKHETVLEINLSAIQHNLSVYKSSIPKDTQIMVMLKAFGYGAGTFEIANILQYNNISYIGVAYADEGVALRNHGINTPIMVMSPEMGAFNTIISRCLEPEIYSLGQAKQFIAAAINKKCKDYPIHIKIDTGMHRLGFFEDEVEALVAILKDTNAVKVKSVFSHLAAADNAKKNEFTNAQLAIFSRVSDKIKSLMGYSFIRHIANTSGIGFENANFDMVRLGIGLYGIDAKRQSELASVATLKTTISQIKHLKAGQNIGYGAHNILEKDTSIATIKIGYADGFMRKLGNANYKVMINGEWCNTIGNICMDMCMIDITDIAAKETDEVIVFDSSEQIIKMANALQTIPYEVLTNISQRVARTYYYE